RAAARCASGVSTPACPSNVATTSAVAQAVAAARRPVLVMNTSPEPASPDAPAILQRNLYRFGTRPCRRTQFRRLSKAPRNAGRLLRNNEIAGEFDPALLGYSRLFVLATGLLIRSWRWR